MKWLKQFESFWIASTWRAKFVRYSLYTCLGLFGLFVIFTQVLVRFWLWPQIETQKTEFEKTISKSLGVTAQIGDIKAGWKFFRPAFEAKNITFLGSHPDLKKINQPLLSIPEVSGVLRWDSILGLAPRFQELKNNQANLEIFRSSKGQWFVAGVEIPESNADSSVLDWLMTENDFILENLQINVLDELEKTNSLKTTVKKFELRNSGRSHLIQLIAHSELAKGDLFFEGDFKHRLFTKRNNWLNWYGDFSWNVEGINLANLTRLTKLPVRVNDGIALAKGNFELNQGKLINGQGTLFAENLDFTWLSTNNNIQLKKLHGEFLNSSEGDLQFLTAKTLSWKFANDPLNAPEHTLSNSSFGWSPNSLSKPLETIALRSPVINLKEINRLAQSLPLPENILKKLNALNPRGTIEKVEVIWQPGDQNRSPMNLLSKDEPALSLKANLNQVGWDALPDIPGISGLSGTVSNEKLAGNIEINSKQLSIDGEHLIHRKQAQIDEAIGSVFWKKIDDQWTFGTKDLKLKNSDLDLVGNMSYQIATAKKPSFLDLNVQVVQVKVSELPGYLPANTPKGLLRYLEGTLIDGTAKNGRITIKGNPTYIPFSAKNPGMFEFETQLENTVYRPTPKNPKEQGQWLPLTHVQGVVKMNGNLLSIDLPSAQYESVTIKNSKAKADFSKALPQIEISSQAQGDTDKFIDYLSASPILIKHAASLKNIETQGQTKLDLGLIQNLDAKGASKFSAKINLENNLVKWDKKSLGKITDGSITLKDNGFSDTLINAEVLNGPLQIKNQNGAGWGLAIKGAVELPKLVELVPGPSSPTAVAIKKQFKGKVNYQGNLSEKIANGLTLEIDLKQAAIDLPPPLSKPLGVAMPGVLTIQSKDQGIDWNLQLAQRFQSKGRVGANGKVQGHGISLGNLTANPPASGTNITFDVDFLDGDAWSDLLSKTPPSTTKTVSNDKVSGVTETISGKFKRIKFTDRVITDFAVSATNDKSLWKANVTSQHIVGTIEWQAPKIGLPSGEIKANLSKLHIPPDEDTSQTLTTGLQKTTAHIPKLDITATNFVLGNKPLGNLEIKATNTEKTWQMDTLKITHPSAKFNATATWLMPDKNSLGQTDMQFEITTNDGGKLMNSLGYAKVLDEGEGQMSGKISWQGAPYSFNKQTLSGDLKFEVRKGKLMQVDPGAAKLLGILSFQSLFKLATLNIEGGFGDAILPGTYFDKLAGSANFRRGVARTEDFELNSNMARMTARGQVNLNRETQDLRATVYPKVNLGGTSVAAFYFVNPIVGLSTLVGQFLLTSGVNKALQADYLIQGSWKSPEIIPLDQKGQPADPEMLKNIRRKSLLNPPSESGAKSVNPNTPSALEPAKPTN